MWGSLISALLSDIPSSFQYTIGEPIEPQTIGGLFKLAEANHKANKYDRVSAFIFERKGFDANAIEEAGRAIKFAKSLRHPFILSVRDVLETTNGNLYIITEQAIPLAAYLAKPDNNNRFIAKEILPWNIKCITEALDFLHQANIVHRALCLETIFVCSEGQWKIGIPEMGLDLQTLSPLSNTPASSAVKNSANPLKVLYDEQSSSPYSVQPLKAAVNSKAADLYMLACALSTLWTLCSEKRSRFNPPSSNPPSLNQQDGRDGPRPIASDALGRFPPVNSVKWSLQSNKKSLKDSDPLLSSVIQALAENDEETFISALQELQSGSHIIPVMLFFQNYALQNSWDLEKFFESTFPRALESSRTSSAAGARVRALVYLPKLSKILAPKETDKMTTTLPQHIQPQALRIYVKLLEDSSVLSKEAFDEIGWRTINILYHDPERSTRFMLLSSIESYANHLDARQIQQIFDEVLAGLLDSSQELRDVTLRGLTVILPRLIEADLIAAVDRALKVISGMISTDKSPSVRTNAAVCLSKVALLLRPRQIHSRTTQGFMTAIADSFAPCRLAGLEGLRKTLSHIPKQDLAATVLPAACPRLIDDDPQCRYAAHRFVRESVEGLSDDIISPMTPPSISGLIQNRATEVRSEPIEPTEAFVRPPEVPTTAPVAVLSSQTPTRETLQTPASELLNPRDDPVRRTTEFDKKVSKPSPRIVEPEVAQVVVPAKAPTTAPRPPPSSRSTEPKPDPTDKFWSEVNNSEDAQPLVKRSLGAARRTNANRSAA